MDTTSADGSASLPNPVPFGPTSETVREIPPLLAATPADQPVADPIEDDDDVLEIAANPDDPENSSILDALGRGPDSVVRRENFGSNSGLNLLNHLRPKDASGILPSTDRIGALPQVPIGIDEEDLLISSELAEDDDSSAVDLGSRPVVDMPYPLGVDSSTGSSVVAMTFPGPANSHDDSAAVDLLDENSEFNLHKHPGASAALSSVPVESGSALSFSAPPSGGAGSWTPWINGGAIGAAAATVLFAVAYFTVLAPANASRPIVTAPSPAPNARLNAELEASAQKYSELASKLAAAGINPDRLGDWQQQLAEAAAARDQARDALAKLTAATAELDALKAAEAKHQEALLAAQRARDQLAPLAQQLKDAGFDAASLPAELKKWAEARRESERAAQEALTRAAALEKDMQKSLAAVRDAESRVAAAGLEEQKTRKALAQFQQSLNQRLSDARLVAAGASADELLAGVDKALARRTEVAVTLDPAQSDRFFAAGVRAYRDRDYPQAEQALASAVQLQNRDARIRYLLGVVRFHQGRSDAALAEFHAAAALEQQHAPGPHDVDEFLARLPSPDRTLVNRHRP